jgi:hypothetical protein
MNSKYYNIPSSRGVVALTFSVAICSRSTYRIRNRLLSRSTPFDLNK